MKKILRILGLVAFHLIAMPLLFTLAMCMAGSKFTKEGRSDIEQFCKESFKTMKHWIKTGRFEYVCG